MRAYSRSLRVARGEGIPKSRVEVIDERSWLGLIRCPTVPLRFGRISLRLSVGQIAFGAFLLFGVVTVLTYLDVSAYLDRVASSTRSSSATHAFPLSPVVW